MFSLIIFIISLFLCIFLAVLCIRNIWVLRSMLALNRFEGNVHLVKQYADYETILYKFWIWDIEKFRKG